MRSLVRVPDYRGKSSCRRQVFATTGASAGGECDVPLVPRARPSFSPGRRYSCDAHSMDRRDIRPWWPSSRESTGQCCWWCWPACPRSGRIANRPRGKKELFILALSAVEHRSYTESISQDLSTDAAGAVVNGKLVLDAVECVFENRIAKLRKRLYVLNFIVIDHGELAKRTIAIGLSRIRPEGTGWEASLIRAGDDRVQVSGHDVEIGIEHAELVVIQQRLSACRSGG